MTTKDFVVSADGHIVEPNDLFHRRLPVLDDETANLIWETNLCRDRCLNARDR